jgi:hypothetical protein
MSRISKVFIFCPAGVVSGGPEALHQLSYALRQRGVAAFMVYYPRPLPVPEPYRRYQPSIAAVPDDDEDSLIVVAEVITSIVWRFKRATRAIWWLSVDNYFKWQHINPGPSVLEDRPDIAHLCQSHYVRMFLTDRGVTRTLMLTDYLTPEIFSPGPAAGRSAVIAYNPKRAPETTERLMAGPAGHVWLPLEGMDQDAVAALLRQVRVYADFGQHPGRDRIPREAALSGAVVVTGRRGAAAFPEDLPIPDRFRLDEQAPDFESQAHALLTELLGSETAFAEAWAEQASYRAWAGGDRDRFEAEVDRLAAALGMTVEEPSLSGA